MTKNVQEILKETALALQNAGFFSPRLEARMLLAGVLGVETQALLFMHDSLSNENERKLSDFIQRRLNGEPVCKILGYKDFYKYRFIDDKNVLSPRPDTEILLEAAMDFARNIPSSKILDLGTGSGCILLSLLAELKDSTGMGVDISNAALDVCCYNAKALNVETRCELVRGSWFDDDTLAKLGSGYDIIVTNPPYIPTEDIAFLDKEVRNFDPLTALDGGKDGFDHYRRLAEISPQLMNDNGRIFIEAGINQAEQISGLFSAQGLKPVEILRDLNGINRCVILKK